MQIFVAKQLQNDRKEVIKTVKFITIITDTIMPAFLPLYNIYLEWLSQAVKKCHASISSFRTSFEQHSLFFFFLNFQTISDKNLPKFLRVEFLPLN